MKFTIHAVSQRMWYVEDYLIPSMTAQGIERENITVWNDTEGRGNLFSFTESMKACGEMAEGVWHLQDDVIISRRFAELAGENDEGIVAGFCCRNFGPSLQQYGVVPSSFLWYSFQCIRIPADIAKRFADWFYNDAIHWTRLAPRVVERKNDDLFFREFILDQCRDMTVNNLVPNMVDHIDYLIGGTLINQQRLLQRNQAAFFADMDLVEELERKLSDDPRVKTR